jgi:hypothetical protein
MSLAHNIELSNALLDQFADFELEFSVMLKSP